MYKEPGRRKRRGMNGIDGWWIESMIGCQIICDGDMRVVDGGKEARNGQASGVGSTFIQSPSTPSSPNANTRAQSPHKS